MQISLKPPRTSRLRRQFFKTQSRNFVLIIGFHDSHCNFAAYFKPFLSFRISHKSQNDKGKVRIQNSELRRQKGDSSSSKWFWLLFKSQSVNFEHKSQNCTRQFGSLIFKMNWCTMSEQIQNNSKSDISHFLKTNLFTIYNLLQM